MKIPQFLKISQKHMVTHSYQNRFQASGGPVQMRHPGSFNVISLFLASPWAQGRAGIALSSSKGIKRQSRPWAALCLCSLHFPVLVIKNRFKLCSRTKMKGDTLGRPHNITSSSSPRWGEPLFSNRGWAPARKP